MFAGIVEEAATVVSLERSPTSCKFVVQSKLDHSATSLGDSIAIDGVCLTVVHRDGGKLTFDLLEETLRCTALGRLKPGHRVNLERSLRVGDRIAGHFVFGHVDTVATLFERIEEAGSFKLTFEVESWLRPFLAPKGSISVSGTSLTLGPVEANRFSVYIIPHTAEVTILGQLKRGDTVNIEIDMLARYVHSAVTALVSDLQATGDSKQAGITLDFLRQHGFAPRAA